MAEFFPFLILIYHIVNIMLALISMIFAFYGLKYQRIISRKLNNNFSPILTTYFLFMLIYTISFLVFTMYLLIFWRPNENIYNIPIMFSLGVFNASLIHLSTVMEIFLAIDRCLTIIFPIKYKQKWQKLFSIFVIFFLIFSFFLVNWISDLLNTIPKFFTTECLYFDCIGAAVKRKYTYEIKMTLCGINTICGIILLLLFKVYNKNSTHKNNDGMKRINKTLLIIIFGSLVFEVIPNLISQMLLTLKIVNQRPTMFLGPYMSTFCLINNAICIGLCFRALRTNSANVTVGATTTISIHKIPSTSRYE